MTVLSCSILVAIVSLSLSSSVFADKVIKSVDESGNVIYSDKAVVNSVSSERVPLQPGPSEADVKQAQESLERTRKLNEEMQQSRKSLEQERKDEKAKQVKSEPAPVVNEPSGYPSYHRPLEPGLPPPPIDPPGSNTGDHPAYQPGFRPPVAVPLPRGK